MAGEVTAMGIRGMILLLLGVLLLTTVGRVGAGEGGTRSAEIERFRRQDLAVGNVRGTGGVELRYAVHRAAAERGALVIVGGRAEYAEKYAELLYDLKDAGFSLYIYDHRGQGLSGRLLADRAKGHVDDFDDYVADLGLFIERVVRPQKPKAIILLSHSMGGTVALLYAARHRGGLDGIILCSPMLSINTWPLPAFLARIVCRAAVHAGLGEVSVPGSWFDVRRIPFAGNRFTGSRERFETNRRLLAADQRLAIGAPTFAWVDQALAATKNLMQRPSEPRVPVLLLQGAEDRVVGGEEQRRFCRRLDDCRLVRLAGARHEVLMEVDPIRERALREIYGFIAATGRRGTDR